MEFKNISYLTKWANILSILHDCLKYNEQAMIIRKSVTQQFFQFQYVLFPPYTSTSTISDASCSSLSSSDDEADDVATNDDAEVKILTEIWVEPQVTKMFQINMALYDEEVFIDTVTLNILSFTIFTTYFLE